MGDINCAKCGEPWDAYGVRNGDMTEEEAKKFLAGEGCPGCGFGSKCPQCHGTGKHRFGITADTETDDPCNWCDGTGKLKIKEERSLEADFVESALENTDDPDSVLDNLRL